MVLGRGRHKESQISTMAPTPGHNAPLPLTLLNTYESSSGPFDCCDGNPKGTTCDRPYFLDRALGVVGHLADMRADKLDLAELQNLLSNNRLIGVRIGWRGKGGHFVVVAGVLPDADPYVEVHDPGRPTGEGSAQVRMEDLIPGIRWSWRMDAFVPDAELD